jgi:hypothetical protein
LQGRFRINVDYLTLSRPTKNAAQTLCNLARRHVQRDLTARDIAQWLDAASIVRA